ncbi:hypothetical protein CMI38_02810 [Candidatus Pacearchaeota archaeon]|nr:hypothetical protein [Candidatus Pacearchaeota archaeon]|tara:strand:+ start:261 stop:998 length:738 start_codon:yes stop_codon:yes gene_type:complete
MLTGIDIAAHGHAVKCRVNDDAYKILDALMPDRPLNDITVEHDEEDISLQEFLTTVRSADGHLDGTSFNVFASMPNALRNVYWTQSGMPISELESENLARKFEEYTFANKPEFRNLFFGTLSRTRYALNEVPPLTRFGAKHVAKDLRERLHRLTTNRDTIAYAEDLIPAVRARHDRLETIELSLGDLGMYNPANLFSTSGWKEMGRRYQLGGDLSDQVEIEATKTVKSLNSLGNEYRSNYLDSIW